MTNLIGEGLHGFSNSSVKTLVGEVDFSFHIVKSSDSSEESLRDSDKGKKDWKSDCFDRSNLLLRFLSAIALTSSQINEAGRSHLPTNYQTISLLLQQHPTKMAAAIHRIGGSETSPNYVSDYVSDYVSAYRQVFVNCSDSICLRSETIPTF